MASAEYGPISIFIDRGNSGFGFNIKGTTQMGGTLQAIHGELYPPLQYVSVVDPGQFRMVLCPVAVSPAGSGIVVESIRQRVTLKSPKRPCGRIG